MPTRPPRKKRAQVPAQLRTEAGYRDAINRIATHADEYAGIPMTFEGQQVIVHKSYRFAHVFNQKSQKEGTGPLVVNHWQHPSGYEVNILHRASGKAYHVKSHNNNGIKLLFSTIDVAKAWTLECENKALEKLRSMIRPHLFEMYQLTGNFLETSPRSGLTYIFRRLRPTVVLTPHNPGEEVRVLCCLCLHPMGYYKQSWGGVVVPTDEVIAHLSLMRGDEWEYWKQSNQHPAYRKESGL